MAMTQSITLELPSLTVAQARVYAQIMGARVEEVLAEWTERGMPNTPVESLSDEQVLALCDLQLDKSEAEELRDLHDRQRENELDDAGRVRLEELMQIYHWALLRKSEALKIAVQRGLRPPLG